MSISVFNGDQSWFKQLFELSPDPTWIIVDSQFIECNEAAIRTLGYSSRDELLNVHPSTLSPPTQPDGESSFTKAERMLTIACTKGRHRFEWTHIRADGTHFVAEVTLSSVVLHDHPVIHCVWRDITDRKASEAELRLAASIIANTSEGVMVSDDQGTIISVNAAFTAITGHTSEEAIGQTPSLLKSDHHDGTFYQDLWNAVLTNDCWEGEIWNRRKNGEVYPEWLSINRIPANDGNPTRFVSIFHDISELHRANERIRYLAFHDALTDLPNRALFQDRLNHAIDRAQREQERLAILFMDLDGFKGINDRLGHDIGDLVLKEVAIRIRTHLRRSADTVSRLGGDEFVVLIEDMRELEQCAALAEIIIESVSRPMRLKGKDAQLGISIGVALFPEDGSDGPELMRRADMAMYSAKAVGNGTYRFVSNRSG